MVEAVADASAILALLNGECDEVALGTPLSRCLLSTLNLSEVAAKLADKGLAAETVAEIATHLPCIYIEFDAEQALIAGALRPETRAQGLSLGDRACLALAKQRGLPAITADRAWSHLALGVDVRLIR